MSRDAFEKRVAAALKASADNAVALHTEGMPIIYTDDLGDKHERTLTATPWKLGHGQWVCGVSGKSGGIDCARVVPATAKGGVK